MPNFMANLSHLDYNNCPKIFRYKFVAEPQIFLFFFLLLCMASFASKSLLMKSCPMAHSKFLQVIFSTHINDISLLYHIS